MKVKCYSVRCSSFVPVSPLAYKIECFDGRTDIIPASQVFGLDLSPTKSEAVWIAEWILKKKNVQYSTKKAAWFDSETRKMVPHYVREIITPKKHDAVESNEIQDLRAE